MKARTPMLQQYFRAKDAHPGVLMAMRVGDFYEFYGEDAETAARTLEITLTGRDDGKDNRIAMAGVPFHSVEKYLGRLVAAGFKVALCDQVEDPKQAKGLVRREVTRVLSAGTVLEDSMLPSGKNNFLAAIAIQDGKAALATLDPSTGEFLVTEFDHGNLHERLASELARLMPAELLVSESANEIREIASSGLGLVTAEVSIPAAIQAERILQSQFKSSSLGGFGIGDKPSAISAASMILNYAEKNGLQLEHVDSIATYSVDEFMRLDPSTRRSLELTQNLGDGSRKNTLLEVLDQTVTAMGTRMLRRWIEQPLLDLESISKRHEAVGRLSHHTIPRGDLRDALKSIADIERLVSRCATGLATPRDVSALARSLDSLPKVEAPLGKVALGRLQELRENLTHHVDLCRYLISAIVDDAPLTVREGGIIKPGFDPELDALRSLSKDGKSYIAQLEAAEKTRTGIDRLKVGYNSVFGYYLEISKTQIDRVPEHYIRKQTTANAERYITAELKEHESAVLVAEEKATALEAELFHAIRLKISAEGSELLKTARILAELDVLCSLAEVALARGYVKPEMVPENILQVEAGKHPVVDANTGRFVPNDLLLAELDAPEPIRLMILTGPNMSGKSTFLRQAALIVLMAQIGSFVPAKSGRIGLCDRIFTRIGAKDEIALGQSTFMVEMVESANILNNATDRSLVILDEVGRGTSTYDGLAIAWAMVEHLARSGAKTLFATHYHQLNAIADQIRTVANYRVSVEEKGDQIIWTHRVLKGGTDRSYGLQVARMAGVPSGVVMRAQEVLSGLEEGREQPTTVAPSLANVQMTLFESAPHAVVTELEKLDLDTLTPVEALLKLDEWKKNL